MLRRLLYAPRFTIVGVLTLGAAVGANAAVFGVLNGVLLKPLPYPEAGRLVGLWHTAPGINLPTLNMSPANYFTYRDHSTVFESLGIFQPDLLSVTGAGEPEQVAGQDVTEGVLPLMGVSPAAGRLFTGADDSPNAPQTAMLGYAYWQRKFGGRESIIGQTLQIDGVPRQIIGVLPRGFRFLDEPDPAIVIPLRLNRAETRLGGFSYQGIARLKPGVTIEQANADVARLLGIMMRTFDAPPGFSIKLFEDARIGPALHPLKVDVVGDVGGLLRVLMGGIAIVLVIACANVANLWLVRLEGRRREIALRSALGAGRGRIARELFGECLAIGAVSGAIGLGLAWWGLRSLVALAPAGIPRLSEIHLDPLTIAFTFVLAMAASLLFGALPILKYAGERPTMGMRDGGRSLSQSREQHRMRGVLVVAQVALALVLLIGSALMIRTFVAMMNVNPGFSDPATVQTFRIFLPESLVKEPDSVIRTHEAIRQRLAAVPGVTAAAVGNAVPLDGNSSFDPVFAQDRAYRDGELPKLRRFRFVMPGYFAAIGAPLIAGRDLTRDEIDRHAPVVIVSRNFATEYWGGAEQALRKRIRVASTDDWREIIGVAENVYDDGVSREASSTAYWPMIQDRFETDAVMVRRTAAFVVRTPRAGTDALMNDLRQAVWSVNPNLPLFSINTLGDLSRHSMARTSFMLILLGVAGGMALLLGVVGLYGVIAYSVSQRTREIGIRLALGAQPDFVTRMFVRDGLTLAAIGVVVGLAAAFGVVRLMASLLFQVSPTDPMTYAVVSAALVVIALAATWLPSRRAAAVDPAIALRGE